MKPLSFLKALTLSFALAVGGGVAADAQAQNKTSTKQTVKKPTKKTTKKKTIRKAPVPHAVKQEKITPSGQAERSERYASIIIDYKTRKVLYERDADQLLYSASTTKVMTAYLFMQKMEAEGWALDHKFTVSPYAASQARTNLGLKAGDIISAHDLLAGLMVHSANDGAVVIAEAVSGNEQAFVAKMNATAKALGLSSMHFVNPHGLPTHAPYRPRSGGIPLDDHKRDPNNKSSVRDMAMLGIHVFEYLERNQKYARYFALPTFRYERNEYRNVNKMVGVYPGLDFTKTGYIDASRCNLVASAKQGPHRIFGAVFGAQTGAERANDMTQLLDFGFKKLQYPDATFRLHNNPVTPAVPQAYTPAEAPPVVTTAPALPRQGVLAESAVPTPAPSVPVPQPVTAAPENDSIYDRARAYVQEAGRQPAQPSLPKP